MPFGTEGVEPGIGIALSGGGFRATLFHCGALWRLNDFGMLPRLDRVSSVSGGSITAGVLATKWGTLQFSGGTATNWVAAVIEPLRAFCRLNIDGPAIGEGVLLPWRRVNDVVERKYREHLFGDATLQQLPDRPRFVFNATNLATGVSFRFSKPYAGDYRIGLIPTPALPVALAVAASSAFPPFLSPVILEPGPGNFHKTEGADLYDQSDYRKRLLLTDGGAYDNLGLETVWNRYETVLASDAGAPFGLDVDPETAWHSQVLRALDIATSQSRGLRKRALIDDFKSGVRKGTYWGIMTEIASYQLADALPVRVEATRYLWSIRTRLNPFSESEQCRLINGGYALCDAAMRKYVLPAPARKAPQWPYPQYALDRPIPVAEEVGAAGDRLPEAP